MVRLQWIVVPRPTPQIIQAANGRQPCVFDEDRCGSDDHAGAHASTGTQNIHLSLEGIAADLSGGAGKEHEPVRQLQ